MRVKNKARSPRHGTQRGFALIALLALLTAGILYFLVGQLDAAAMQRRQAEVTTQALAQAKEALIAYAVGVALTGGDDRPGDLPCPDRDNDGIAGTAVPLVTSCGNAAGTTFQDRRLGRLPWMDLGLPDIRDGSGERLWYAVSNNFKMSTRKFPLNSDTPGSITVRDSAGNILFDGSGATGVVAVVIAPGPPITRQDGLIQDRSAANSNDPRHYLDNITGEDNADFGDGTTNGFFAGPVHDAVNPTEVIANDRLLVITRDEIMAAVEKRVAAEAAHCLEDYAARPQNNGHLPWAASMATSATGDYSDVSGSLFGRLPNSFANTVADSACPPLPPPMPPPMLSNWTGTCMVNNGTWFDKNWRDVVLVSIAVNSKPACPAAGLAVCAPGTCITINTSAAPAVNRSFVVLVAGRSLPGQIRATTPDKSNVANYLELENATPADNIFQAGPTTGTFNDRLTYFPH